MNDKKPIALDSGPSPYEDDALHLAFTVGFKILKGLMIVLILAFVLSGIYNVGQGEKAVVFVFGKIAGEGEDRVKKEGFHWSWPFPISDVVKIKAGNSKPFRFLKFSGPPSGHPISNIPTKDDPITQEDGPGYVVSSGMELLHADWGGSFAIKNLEDFLINVYVPSSADQKVSGNDAWILSSQELILTVLETIIVEEYSKRDSLKILLSKGDLKALVKRKLQKELDEIRSGLKIDNLDLLHASSPDSLRYTYSQVLNAREDKKSREAQALSQKTEIEGLAESDVDLIKQRAEVEKSKMISSIKADAKEMNALIKIFKDNPAYKDQYMKERYMETMGQVYRDADKYIINNTDDLRFKIPEESDKKANQKK